MTDKESKCQPCMFFFDFFMHCICFFNVIIEVPDRVYRDIHYRKDENLGLFDLQMIELPWGTVLH